MARSNQGPDWYVSRIRAAWKQGAEKTIEACRLLAEAKEECSHEYNTYIRDELRISQSTDNKLRKIGGHAPRLTDLNDKYGLPSSWTSLYYVALIVEYKLVKEAIQEKLLHISVEGKELEAFYQKNIRGEEKTPAATSDKIDFVTIRISSSAATELKQQLLSDAAVLQHAYSATTELRHDAGAQEFLADVSAKLLAAFEKERNTEMLRLKPANISENEMRVLADAYWQFRTWTWNEFVKEKLVPLSDQIKKLKAVKRRTNNQNAKLEELEAEKASLKVRHLPYDPKSLASIEHPGNAFSINPKKGESWTFDRLIAHLREKNILLPAAGIRERAEYSKAWCLDLGITAINGTPAERAACRKTLEDTIRGEASAKAQGVFSRAADAKDVKSRLQEAFLWE